MEMQHILIFALIGAVCMVIITGGFISMSSDTNPSPTQLASGAAVGTALGAAVSYMSSASNSLSDMMGGDSSVPEMKVGLPAF